MTEISDSKRGCTCPYCHRFLRYTNADITTFEEPKWGGIIVRTVIGIICPACEGRIVLAR